MYKTFLKIYINKPFKEALSLRNMRKGGSPCMQLHKAIPLELGLYPLLGFKDSPKSLP